MKEKNMVVENNKKEYENAVDNFFMITRGKLDTFDAVATLGVLLYASKEDLNENKQKESLNSLLETANQKLGNAMESITHIVASIDKASLPAAFEYALKKLAYGKDSSAFIQPAEFGRLATAMIQGTDLTVYNPFSGMMSYPVQLDNFKSMKCVDINNSAMQMGLLRLALADTTKSNLVDAQLSDVRDWDNGHYDLIVATPPFRHPIKMNDSGNLELSDTIALPRFEKSTTDKGQLFTIIPASFLWSGKEYTAVKKELIDKDYISTIVLLPANIFFSTSINTAVVYLSKQKDEAGKINLIDATDCFYKDRPTNILNVDAIIERLKGDNDHKISLSKEDVADHNYMLDPNYYKVDSNLVIPEGYKAIRFSELATQIKLSRHFEEASGHLVTVGSIDADVYNCLKDVKDFAISDKLQNATKLTEPALLVSTIGKMKCCYVQASEENPLFVGTNIMAFSLNSEVITPEYLCLELSRKDIPSYGLAIPHLDKDLLMRSQIVIPSLDAQRKEFSEFAQENKLTKARELGLQEVIDSMKADYINEVRMRKHDMRPYLRNLAAEEKMLRHLVDHRDDIPYFAISMTKILNSCRADIKKLSELLDNLSNEQKFGKPELVNIDEYLINSPLLQDTPLYTYDYDRDDDALDEAGLLDALSEEETDKTWKLIDEMESKGEVPNDIYWPLAPGEYPEIGPKLLVSIAPNDLDRMVENIVSNSVHHGFTDTNRNDYQIWENLSYDKERGMFVIDFVDNGKPLPKGMNKERYGLRGEKAGATGGTGLGGNIVKEIVKHYGGDYDIFSNGEGTTVRIWLPVAKIEED